MAWSTERFAPPSETGEAEIFEAADAAAAEAHVRSKTVTLPEGKFYLLKGPLDA